MNPKNTAPLRKQIKEKIRQGHGILRVSMMIFAVKCKNILFLKRFLTNSKLVKLT
jgi:hypothetical protein